MYRRLLLTFALIVLLAGPAIAGDSTTNLDELLDALVAKQVFTQAEADAFRARWKAREAVAQQGAQNQQSTPRESDATATRPDSTAPIAKSTDTVRTFGGIHLSGYAQARFTSAPSGPSTFEIRRARVIADGDLSENISYQLQVDGVKPQLLDARLDLRLARQFQITAGEFKIPFSYESLLPDNQSNLIERSNVVNNFAPGRDNGSVGRDLGVQASGKLWRFHGAERLEYATGVFNGAGLNTRDDNHSKDLAARMVFHPMARLSVGADYYRGAVTAKQIRKERFGTEAVYKIDRIGIATEYIWGHDGTIHRSGWYAETSYRASNRWQPVFRFDKFDPGQVTASLRFTENYVFGANYFLNNYVKLQANYGEQHDITVDRYHSIFLVQTQFSFGGEKEIR